MNLKTHIILEEPYEMAPTAIGLVPLQKALCGQKEPWSQARGGIKPTCKACLRIWKSGKHEKLAAGSPFFHNAEHKRGV